MELFYLNEHTSCYNYSKSMQEGFRYYKFDEGLNHEEELVKDCILFVLKGSLQFSCNGFQFTVSSGEMVFFSVTACLTPNHWKNVKSWLPCSRGEYGPVKGPPFQSYTT